MAPYYLMPMSVMHLLSAASTTAVSVKVPDPSTYTVPTSTYSPSPDPAPKAATYENTAIVRPRDPLAHLAAEEHRRRTKQMRKAQRPPWRR